MIGAKLQAPPEGQDAFTDILFNALLGFAFMFALAFMLIRPDISEGKIAPKAEFLITATWGDTRPDDVDLIVEDGAGNLVWFDRRQAGLMHLDRDDRGLLGDVITINGERIINHVNQEIVSLRGVAAGEYVVNLLHYKAPHQKPIAVQVKIEKLNPHVQIIYVGKAVLQGAGDEQTLVRFHLDDKGDVVRLSTRQKDLLRAHTSGGGESKP